MNKKISLGVAISLVAIGCAITFVLTWTVSLKIYNGKLVSSDTYEGMYAKLREIDATVRNNYINSVSDEQIANGVINGYVAGIGDKYASYMAADSYYELQQTNSGIIMNAGFDAEEDGSGYLLVTTVYRGSSAELNGVEVGDVITEIDGKSLLSMEPGTAAGRLSGEIGTRIALKLLRDGEEVSVNLIRQQLEIESVTSKVINGSVGYIRITSFNGKTAEQFAEHLNTLTEADVKALIIDVRQNGGGLVSSLKPILDRFIPAAIIATAEYSDGSRRTLIETDSEVHVELPIAILVDGGTASASELLAVALRDECGAVLVGTQTYGKAVMQNTYEFPDGSAITLSTAKVYPSKSDSYDGIGLKPDYLSELPAGAALGSLSDDMDSQLQKALEVIAPNNGN
ncbi:MAG: PDZ domain-containing protein [Oscillospiraceae bacterium]|nr:PDZ domain-containing protein [Oscillospiraceae bacterium]